MLLLATLLGKCWGVWSLHNDRKDERRKKHERKLAGVPTLRRGPMAEISYETSGRDFFLGKSNAQYETRRGGSNFPNPPRDGRLPPGYGKGYSAGGNIPTTRNRAGRFEAGLQTNQWWKVKLQRAFGSSSAPDEKYTEFPESYAMTERRESADVNDQAEVSSVVGRKLCEGLTRILAGCQENVVVRQWTSSTALLQPYVL